MKKLLLTLVVIAVVSFTPKANAVITIVQHASTSSLGAAVTTLSLAFPSNNAAGNLLIYYCVQNATTFTTTSTDSNANTIVTSTDGNVTNGGVFRVDYVKNSKSGANTAKCQFSSANRAHIHIWEVSGIDTTNPVDQVGTSTLQTGLSRSATTTGATAQANELLFGTFYDQPNNDTLTAGFGFSPSEFSDGGAAQESALSEVKIISATGVQTVTATSSNTTNGTLNGVITFKGAAAASGATNANQNTMGSGIFNVSASFNVRAGARFNVQ